MKTQVAIIGGGLAGLSCARRLQDVGIEWQLFEASDGLGGRVRTDMVDGFRLDRGFQVILEAYPECRNLLDYDELDLRPFAPGAKVWVEARLHTVADPLRAPAHIVESINAPIGSMMDKLRVLGLRKRAMEGSLSGLFARPETTTHEALEELGFTRQMIDTFFRPWLGGIFLDQDLTTSSRMMDFVVRMMATGRTSVPADGMGAIPAQIAESLPADSIYLGRAAKRVTTGRIEFEDGEIVEAERIVIATEAPVAARLLGRPEFSTDERGVICLYYALDEAPVEGPWLILDGDRSGPINNLAFMSQVSPTYSPAGRELAAVTVLQAGRNETQLLQSVGRQLRRWFGGGAEHWQHLATYQIPHAQPAQPVGFREARRGPAEPLPGVFICGDHRETASINGALRSGRHGATKLSRELRQAVGA